MAKKTTDNAGASVGQALVNLLTDALVKARAGILPHEMVEKWKHTDAWMDKLEGLAAPYVADVVGPYLAKESLPDGLRGIFGLAAEPEHQLDFILQIIAILGAGLTGIGALGAVEIRQAVQELNTENANVPLSPADAADGVNRGVLSQDTAALWASQSGVGSSVFNEMIQLSGEPPGIMDMVALWRRGAISEADLQSAILYSRIHPDYYEDVLQMAYSYMSPADVIELAIKGVVDPGTAQTMFGLAGGLTDQFDVLYQAAGDAIGAEQAMSLWNQGLIDQSMVQEVLGRTRMNPIFYPVAELLRYKFLQPFQIGELLGKAPQLASQATQWMINLGYGAEQAGEFVAAYSAVATTSTKAETEATIVALYTDMVITEAQAQVQLTNLGYDLNSATMILALADAKKLLSQQTAAVNAIKSAYLNRKIDRTQASMDLDQLQLPADAREQWLSDWDIELTLKVKELTAAQVGKLVGDGYMTAEIGIQYFQNMGYAPSDVNYIAAIYGFGPLVAPTTDTTDGTTT